MNQFSQAVNYIEQYLDMVSPIINEGEKQFPEIETRLEYCVKMLKSNPFYEGKVD